MNNLEIIHLSTIPLLTVQLDSIDSESVCRELDKLKYIPINNDPEVKTSATLDAYGLLNYPQFTILRNEIERNFNYFVKEIYSYECEFKAINSWATKTVKGLGSAEWHRHTNCMFTAVYYPKGGGDYAPLILDIDKKRDYYIDPKEMNQYNSIKYFIEPHDNQLIIFPSNISHSIGRHLSDKIRYSIAVDYTPIV